MTLLVVFSFSMFCLLAGSAVQAGEPRDDGQIVSNGLNPERVREDLSLSVPSGSGNLSPMLQEDDGGQKKKEGDELPPVRVIEEATSSDQPVGPYNQPAWTAQLHRWGTTRAYVLPPGTYEAELWHEASYNEGSSPEHELLQEFMVGLPNRFQLDFYTEQKKEPGQDSFHFAEIKTEVRWALADWGEIPLNPTFYAEWETAANEDADAVEYKVLLADNLAPGLHWAGNLVYEQSYSGSRETEVGVTTGISKTITDLKFSVGLEAEAFRKTEKGSRSDPEHEFLVGPSLEYKPTKNTALRFAPLAGLGGHSPDLKTFLIFGVEFGAGATERIEGPKSTESR